MTSIHSPQYVQFLRRLKAARLEAGLTQVDAAKALGKPQSFVSKCESGERRVDVIELQDLARVYHRPLQFFLHESKKKTKTKKR